MKGKVLGLAIVAIAVIAGAGIWYLQVYAYYQEVAVPEIVLTSAATGRPELIAAGNASAIDATSSPLRYRACFTMPYGQAMLVDTYVTYDNAVPLNAPDWFECFNAEAVGLALESGQAIAFLGQAGIHDGVDRVVAVFDDGRAFSWHQLSEEQSN